MVDGEIGTSCFEALEEAVAEESDRVLVRVRGYLRSVRIVVSLVGALLEHLDCIVSVSLIVIEKDERLTYRNDCDEFGLEDIDAEAKARRMRGRGVRAQPASKY